MTAHQKPPYVDRSIAALIYIEIALKTIHGPLLRKTGDGGGTLRRQEAAKLKREGKRDEVVWLEGRISLHPGRKSAAAKKSKKTKKAEWRPAPRQSDLLLLTAGKYSAMVPKGADPMESVDKLLAAFSAVTEQDYAATCGQAASTVYETALGFQPLLSRLKSLFHIMYAHPADAIKRAEKIASEAVKKRSHYAIAFGAFSSIFGDLVIPHGRAITISIPLLIGISPSLSGPRKSKTRRKRSNHQREQPYGSLFDRWCGFVEPTIAPISKVRQPESQC